MPPVEKATDLMRPRTRRAQSALTACQDCKCLLSLENWSPSMRGETGQRPRYICRGCWTARQRRYGERRSPEERRTLKKASLARRHASWSGERKAAEADRRYGSWLMRTYGISLAEYVAMLEAQEGACAICLTTTPDGRGRFHVDHCHELGHVRGLLCAKCNLLLGHANDSTDRLRAAIGYLTKTKAY